MLPTTSTTSPSAPSGSQPLSSGKSASSRWSTVPTAQRLVPGSGETLQSAHAALDAGGLCSPQQVALLKKEYGSIEPLIDRLGPTFVGVDGLKLSGDEWESVVKTYPLAVAKIPLTISMYGDFDPYIEALHVSGGSAEVVEALPKKHKWKICREAARTYPDLIRLLPPEERPWGM